MGFKARAEQSDLVKTFEALGVEKKTAAMMAKYETEHGSPQLARDIILREMWGVVLSSDAETDGQPSWIEGWLRYSRATKTKPEGAAAALDRLLAAGVSAKDLTAVVREMQSDALRNFCDVLDGEMPTTEEQLGTKLDVRWGLHEHDTQSQPHRQISALHESFHSYDPEGEKAHRRYGKARG